METKDILKELRTIKGFSSAKDFCEMAGISYNTYQNYETGKRLPTAEILMRLADFYNVSTDYLLGRTPVREMNRLPKDEPTEEEVKTLENQIVESYTRMSVETRRACIKALMQIVGDVFLDLQDEDEYEDLAEDPQDSAG